MHFLVQMALALMKHTYSIGNHMHCDPKVEQRPEGRTEIWMPILRPEGRTKSGHKSEYPFWDPEVKLNLDIKSDRPST